MNDPLKQPQNAIDILLSIENEFLDLGVWKNADGKIGVKYQHCEIKEGDFLKTVYGIGKTFAEACENYLEQLHGKTLVFYAYSQYRKEIKFL